jgi:demethylmenaquinone methyltransferase/2-methoxy-6-polyprenyl-1,4-benzoquinol methylase
VAPYYDALNAVLSLGMDRLWRQEAAVALALRRGDRVLDVATGTGALAAEIAKATSGGARITGCDLNERMLAVARERTARTGTSVELVQCDATRLPFSDAAFDAATVAFAIDDMPDRAACVREIRRVLRPGGRLVLLELSQPDHALLRAGYLAYLRVFRAFRRLGYDHLEREIRTYRGSAAIETLLRGERFVGYRSRGLSGGIARLHLADKDFGAS